MRLRACISAILLGLGGCAAIPEWVRIDVDGRWIEVRQRGFELPPAVIEDRWSVSRDCDTPYEAPALSAAASVRVIGADEIEVTSGEAAPLRLYRCKG